MQIAAGGGLPTIDQTNAVLIPEFNEGHTTVPHAGTLLALNLGMGISLSVKNRPNCTYRYYGCTYL